MLFRHSFAALTLILGLAGVYAPALADDAEWKQVLDAARGQTVYWNAWGGDPRVNAYIDWAGEQADARYGISVVHVKLTDTAEAVARVLAEKSAGRSEGGAVDLIWINGENFAAMKRNGLLFGPWLDKWPNHKLTDPANSPDLALDFGVPVDGLEMPWARARLVFYRDTDVLPDPPGNTDSLLAWAQENPGRFTYPQPPDFIGTAFLKQLLIETVPDRSVLYEPAGEGAEELVRAHLIPLLERLHPDLWRSGVVFPQGVADLRRLFADGEIRLALTHNPSDAAAAVKDALLPETVAVAAFDTGTIGNVHFVAIPRNAGDKAGAMVVANFLLSPEAQARKADPDIWGDPAVIDVDKLDPATAAAFPASVRVDAPTLQEPHASWTPIIEHVWNETFLK